MDLDQQPRSLALVRVSAVTSGSAFYALVVSRTWILQSNPKLYDIDAAVRTLEIIYWRIPQYTGEVHASDRALIWRSGKEAGFVSIHGV